MIGLQKYWHWRIPEVVRFLATYGRESDTPLVLSALLGLTRVAKTCSTDPTDYWPTNTTYTKTYQKLTPNLATENTAVEPVRNPASEIVIKMKAIPC